MRYIKITIITFLLMGSFAFGQVRYNHPCDILNQAAHENFYSLLSLYSNLETATKESEVIGIKMAIDYREDMGDRIRELERQYCSLYTYPH